MDAAARLQHHLQQKPDTAAAAFVAASADVMGAVTLKKDSSVWYQTVLRGDIQTITVGEGSNIQDGTVVHLADDGPAVIGDYTTIGHQAMIHACTIGNETLVGMGAIILDYANIGNQCIIGAGSLVTKGTVIPDGSMVLGSPGKVVRPLKPEERAGLRAWAEKYIHVARAHAALNR
ncbi:MAG: gamma carbonic anhydrase family protein [Candidatus Methylacidiphilales bacterium]|nr:gamma carbonic anhydrase family protein [Candidatus Methylacidiphilales bacterium]